MSTPAYEVISSLPSGVPKGTDLTPATDTTDPSSAATGTTKKYLRSDELNFYLGAQGLVTYGAVQVATTLPLTAVYNNGVAGVGATLTNSGTQLPIVIDGVSLAVGARVLVKNQAATADNGIYVVTTVGNAVSNWVLTRSADYDTSTEIVQFGVVLSDQGVMNAGILWQETGIGPFTIGTTPITFAQYTSAAFGISWSGIAGTSYTAAVNNGYVIQDASQTTVTLPVTAALGSIVKIAGFGAGGWVLVPGIGQTINVLNAVASSSITSAEKNDAIEVVCVVANTTWLMLSCTTTGFTVL